MKVKGHGTVFVNPPRLSDFKQVLTKAGVQVHRMGCVLGLDQVAYAVLGL